LRNLVRKLGGDDDALISFRTAQYRLHYYETPSSLRFVLLTDTSTLSMRSVLHQIYINLWVEYGEFDRPLSQRLGAADADIYILPQL
jgi:trafficking protein particle complex subunit 1